MTTNGHGISEDEINFQIKIILDLSQKIKDCIRNENSGLSVVRSALGDLLADALVQVYMSGTNDYKEYLNAIEKLVEFEITKQTRKTH